MRRRAARLLAAGIGLLWLTGAGGSGLPLEPERRLGFDTAEGTWMSLDVSPDGETIAFDLLGDLYLLDAGGGEARPLTGGIAFDSQPAFSPDGSEILFVSDRSGTENLWAVTLDGDARQITRREANRVFVSPAWSADGSRVFATIFFADLNAYELWAFDASGGGEGEKVVPIKPSSDAPRDQWTSSIGAAPSSDGRYVYFARHQGPLDDETPEWTVHRKDLRTGETEAVIQPAETRRRDGVKGSYFRPVVSPDGERLVYATRYRGRTGFRLRNLATREDRWLAFPVQRDQLGASPWMDILPGYSFTPDGKALVYSHEGRIRRLTIASGETREIPFDARVEVELGPELRVDIEQETGPVRARVIQWPEQSPDGRRLAFSALGRVYTQTLGGDEKPAPLVDMPLPQYQPSWSPDGEAIVFVTWTARDAGHVWVAPADGEGEPRRITSVADFYERPAFSPDGESVVLLRSSHDVRMHRYMEYGQLRDAELVVISLEGGTMREVTSGEMGGKPHFVGGRVVLSFADGVHAVDLQDGERRRLVEMRGPGWYFVEGPGRIDEVAVGPDGRYALAKNAQQLFLVTLPANPDEPLDISGPPGEYRQITRVGADFFGWADDGETVAWSVGSTYRRCPLVALEEHGGAGALPDCGRVESHEAVVEVPRDRPRGTLLLEGATVITMEDGRVIEDAEILIENDRIAGVAAAGELAVPENADVLDVSGRYVVPGLIDVHNHLADIRRGILDFESWGPAANLAYGVTTAFDPSPLSIDMLAYEDLVDAGLMTGSRIHSTGPAIFSFNRFESLDEVRSVLRRHRDHYRTRNIKMYRSGNRRVRQWVAMAADELEMMPTTEGALAMKLGMTQILDGFAGLEHEIAAVPLGRDVVELVARSGVSYTPTLIISAGPQAQDYFIARDDPANDPKLQRFWPGYVIDMKLRRTAWRTFSDYSFPAVAAGAARVLRAGGRVAVGAHGNVPGLGTHWEMEALTMGGMTPVEALRAGTILAAEAIGRGDEFGSVATGKYADLVILERDPRVSVGNSLAIDQVMKNGRLYDADTLDEVWPRQRPFPRPWYFDETPENPGRAQQAVSAPGGAPQQAVEWEGDHEQT